MNVRVLALVLLSACDDFGALDRCSQAGWFCDGFESGDLSKWSGTVSPTFETVKSTHVHSGHYALDSLAPPQGGNGAEGAVYLQLGAPATGTLAVRQYIYSEQPLTSFVGVMQLTDSANPGGEYGEVVADDTGHWTFTEESATGGLHDHDGSIVSVGGVWTCVEVDIELGSASIELFVDGASALTTPLLDPHPTYDNIAVGVTRAIAAGVEDFIDDVVIADQMIGC